jgi:hypothetical protein
MTWSEAVAKEVVKQQEELFRHLPAGLVADDERVHFTLNADGSLSVVVDRTGDLLSLFKGHAVRCIHTASGVEVQIYRNRELIEILPVSLTSPDDEELWKKAPSAG